MSEQRPPKSMWEERYSTEHYVFGTEANDFLRNNVATIPIGDILCLAEGEGRNAVFLAGTARRVSSVDLAEAGVKKTLRLARERGVEVNARVGDLSTYDLGNEKWDGIVSIYAHMAPLKRADLHHRVVEALRPGGIFLLEAYTPDQIGRGTGGPQSIEMTMPLSALKQELAPLEFLHALETERIVAEGVGHTASAAVVQVIARRIR